MMSTTSTPNSSGVNWSQQGEEVADHGLPHRRAPARSTSTSSPTIPFFERMKMLQLHWVKYGFGTPKQTVIFYVWKIFYYALFGLIFAARSPTGSSSTTSPVGGTSRSCTRS